MNRTGVFLLVIIVLLVGAVAYLLGQRTAASPAEPVEPEPTETASDAPAEPSAPVAHAVRIGRDGPHASACDRIGRVANLPGGSGDFLAVREAPAAAAKRIDKLTDDAPFFVCDRSGDGAWRGIVYLGDGTLPSDDRCGLADSVGSVRPYSGACLTGWVSARYVDESGAQDSDEPYVAQPAAPAPAPPRTRVVEATGYGSSQVTALMRMSLRAEKDYGKPVGQRPDGNRADCKDSGVEGDQRWRCTGRFTLTN